ncbi:hypothetical protein [Georgenia sp. Marseille-Q6866]
MPDVQVDTELLKEAGAQLRNVVETFTYAKDDAHALADHVGHGGLAKRVRNFADNWQSRRQDMLETIGTLGDVSEGVGIAFDEWDAQLARAVSVDPETTTGPVMAP